jgi:outer membrane protein OmpA-like peptidoglycan-associated protein
VVITEPPHEKSNKRWWLWLIPVLVIVVGVVYFYNSSTEGDNIPTNAIAEKNTTPEAISIIDSIASEEGTAQSAEETAAALEQAPGTASQSGTTPTTPIPYNQGEAYKVYQFPFGDGNYSKSNPELDKLAKILAENLNVKIQIYAYTDKVGSAEFNQTLSAKRAKAIYDYLVSKGIDKSRLSYQGKGISTKYSSDAENRRAEFILK